MILTQSSLGETVLHPSRSRKCPLRKDSSAFHGVMSVFESLERAMKPLAVLLGASGAILAMGLAITRADTVHVTDDTYIDFNRPRRNFGRRSGVLVGHGARHHAGARVGFARFDVERLPPGEPIVQAHLRIWVSYLHRGGFLEVYAVMDPWDEKTLTADTAPALGPVVATVESLGDGPQELRHRGRDIAGEGLG